jgi:hypothetical protein
MWVVSCDISNSKQCSAKHVLPCGGYGVRDAWDGRYEMHIGKIKLLDYYGGYNEVDPEAYFGAWMVLEEMKSDPCWKYPHR